ncbi:MAG: hypothetical protein WCE75_16920 [Terracidiphilus sp.]
MHETILSSGRDAVLVAIPFLAMLLVGFFRLDEIFASGSHRVRAGRPLTGFDANGEPMLSDPHCRRWN